MYSNLLEFIKNEKFTSSYSENCNVDYAIQYIVFEDGELDRLTIWNKQNNSHVFYMSCYENNILFNLFDSHDLTGVTHKISFLNSVPDYDTSGEDVKFQISTYIDDKTLFFVRVFQEIKKKRKCFESYYQ